MQVLAKNSRLIPQASHCLVHRGPSTSILTRRTYALSRFTDRGPGVSRKRTYPRDGPSRRQPEAHEFPAEPEPSAEESPLWAASQRPPSSDPEEGLRTLLLSNETLVVTRQIEMLNIFIGFEQSNKYVITNENEDTLGFIVEEPRGFLATLSRQAFRTHRPFRAMVMDSAGTPILWLRRPFAWINSRMYVQRLNETQQYTSEGEPVLDTFAEVQQQWHLWRRRYDLFLRDKPRRILSTASDPQPEPEVDSALFNQFARIDEGFLAWDFRLRDARGEEIGSVSRTFRGFGRELFTDTGRYFVRFAPTPLETLDPYPQPPTVVRNLSLNERALVLATAVDIDFDYFSRHSRGGGGMWIGGDWGGE